MDSRIRVIDEKGVLLYLLRERGPRGGSRKLSFGEFTSYDRDSGVPMTTIAQ